LAGFCGGHDAHDIQANGQEQIAAYPDVAGRAGAPEPDSPGWAYPRPAPASPLSAAPGPAARGQADGLHRLSGRIPCPARLARTGTSCGRRRGPGSGACAARTGPGPCPSGGRRHRRTGAATGCRSCPGPSRSRARAGPGPRRARQTPARGWSASSGSDCPAAGKRRSRRSTSPARARAGSTGSPPPCSTCR
jgi:hypothetical protein